jgi:DNA-directed RNA polymerase specialized sigma24 family protein
MANHGRGRRRRDRLGLRLAVVLAEHAVSDPADAIGTAAVVRNAMERLPAEDRELLRLAVWEGLTGPDIAAVLGIVPGTVRTRMHRARLRLRDALQGDPRIDGPAAARMDEIRT